MKSYFFQLILIITIPAQIFAKDHYVYCAAESEDEVALIRFDARKRMLKSEFKLEFGQ